jgi:hypothetical protein
VYRLETNHAHKLEYFRRKQPFAPLVPELEFALKPVSKMASKMASMTADSGSGAATPQPLAPEAPDSPSEDSGRRRQTNFVEG